MDTKIIGKKIAKARKEKNMSQAQVAQLLFISPQAVGKWERGESIPDIITMSRLAEIMTVDLNYFSESFSSTTNEDSIGKIQEPLENTSDNSSFLKKSELTNFNGSNLHDCDFAGINAPNRKFNGSALSGSNFAGANLTGTLFTGSDIRSVNFDETNLTDCILSANSLMNASFNKTIIVRTEFSSSGLDGAIFSNTELIDAKLIKTDLRKTVFENCIFNGVDFKYSDLRGICFEGQTFLNVKFSNTALNEVSFKDSILKNISFRSPYAITNKFYRAIKTICFEGATMDKLTYAALKGLGADLSKVTFI